MGTLIPSDKRPTPSTTLSTTTAPRSEQPAKKSRFNFSFLRFGRKISRSNNNQTSSLTTQEPNNLSSLESKNIKQKKIEILKTDKTIKSLDKLGEKVKQLHESNALFGEQRASLAKQRAKLLSKEKIPHYDAVVAGAGPTGLMAAVELARKGYKVCLCEGRNEEEWDIRSSVMSLRPEATYAINQMLDALESTHGPGYVFSHRKKSDIAHPKSLASIREQVRRNYYTNLQTDVIQRIYMDYAKTKYPDLIDIKHQARAGSFDPWIQTMDLQPSGRIAFDSIIHADGVHGTSRQSLEELGASLEKITVNTPFSGRCQCAYIHHPSWTEIKTGAHLNSKEKIPADLLPKFKKLGWSSNYYPQCYIFLSHANSEKLWISGQCPTNLKPEQQLEWNALICEATVTPTRRAYLMAPTYVDTDSHTARGSKKENLSHAIFTVEKQKLAQPSVALPFGKSEAIGDAKETPNFFFAEGLKNADKDVKDLAIPFTPRKASSFPLNIPSLIKQIISRIF